ncbi:hypothetical protein B484DRAFT_406463 [Ochromonadaceae sp. CCMP2298]|nr:hypothetical protein B484DRAFT_406463 [Ochromonadaceae sp. CCMP2298]
MSSGGEDTLEQQDRQLEGEEEEEEEGEYHTHYDRTIFLIDARSPMYTLNSKGQYHVVHCMQIALDIMKIKIIENPRNQVGIILFGVQSTDDGEAEAKDDTGTGRMDTGTGMGTGMDNTGIGTGMERPNPAPDGVMEVLSLEPPSAERIRALQRLVEDGERLKRQAPPQGAGVGTGVGVKGPCPLKSALWRCSQAFGQGKEGRSNERVWIFTNDDDPFPSSSAANAAEAAAAITVARDCAQSGNDISLWHLDPPDGGGGMGGGRPFDLQRFYGKLLHATVTTTLSKQSRTLTYVPVSTYDPYGLPTTSSEQGGASSTSIPPPIPAPADTPSAEEYEEALAEHVVGAGPMGFDIDASLAGKIPKHEWLSAATAEPAKVQSREFHADTGETVEAAQVHRCVEVSNAEATLSVPFSAEEMKILKKK